MSRSIVCQAFGQLDQTCVKKISGAIESDQFIKT